MVVSFTTPAEFSLMASKIIVAYALGTASSSRHLFHNKDLSVRRPPVCSAFGDFMYRLFWLKAKKPFTCTGKPVKLVFCTGNGKEQNT